MDQDNLNQSQTQEDNPNRGAEASTTASAPASAPATDPTVGHPAGPVRPRRPQRSSRVEGSVDISEPKVEPKAEPAPLANQDESTPDGAVASHHKPSRPAAVKPLGERTGPSIKTGHKGHHPVRAASVPHPPASKHVTPHLNPHAQRALSVAGTADTQAQIVEDFRLHIITWNVGSAQPPDDITALLGLNVGDGNTDMYIIGLSLIHI